MLFRHSKIYNLVNSLIVLLLIFSYPSLALSQEAGQDGYYAEGQGPTQEEIRAAANQIGEINAAQDQSLDEYNKSKYQEISDRNSYPTQERGNRDPSTEATQVGATCYLSNLIVNVAKKYALKAAATIQDITNVPIVSPEYVAKETGVGVVPNLDQIGYCLANSLITYIADSTINWINSGFDGNPVFVDDPKQFFKDVAKKELDEVINELGDGILCQRFDLDIKLALIRNYSRTERGDVACGYDEAVDNIEGLLRGDYFTFEAWGTLTQDPRNNYIGAFLTADSQLARQINEETEALNKELLWADGYLSWKNADGKTVTPGKIVADGASKVTGIATDRLVLADEFDEVVSALVNHLINAALSEYLGESSGDFSVDLKSIF